MGGGGTWHRRPPTSRRAFHFIAPGQFAQNERRQPEREPARAVHTHHRQPVQQGASHGRGCRQSTWVISSCSTATAATTEAGSAAAAAAAAAVLLICMLSTEPWASDRPRIVPLPGHKSSGQGAHCKAVTCACTRERRGNHQRFADGGAARAAEVKPNFPKPIFRFQLAII